MADKEIKVNEQAFETALSKLQMCLETLEKVKASFSSANQNLIGDWIGEGGNGFRNTSEILQDEFEARINNLKQEIYDLMNTKESISKEDSCLGAAIGNAIGIAGAVSAGNSVGSAGEAILSGANSVLD